MPRTCPCHSAALSLLLPGLLWGCDAKWEPADGFGDITGAAQAPVLTLSSPADGATFTTNQVVQISGLVVDPDTELTTIRVALRSDRDGDLGEPSVDASGAFSADVLLTEGEHVLTVTVEDPDQMEDSESVTLQVGVNHAPSAPAVSISPADPSSDDDLTASLTTPSEDEDGDEVTYVWSWTVNGEDAGITTDTVPADRTSDDEIWEVYVYATDGDLDSEITSASAWVNDGPDVTVAISPLPAYADDTLTCAWTATDPDGGEVTASASWLINDAFFADASAPLAGVFAKGDEILCEVSASAASGTTVMGAVLTVQNSPPEVSGVLLSPAQATDASTLSCSASAADVDGDDFDLYYTWYVNGAAVSEGETLTGIWFNRDDMVWCEAAGDDGEDRGPSVASDSITINNTAPTAPVVALSPSSVTAGETLECQIAVPSSDVDGDSLSYEYSWTAGGSPLAETSDQLDTSPLAGETVSCSARADDGTDTSAWSAPDSVNVLGGFEGTWSADDGDLIVSGTESSGAFSKAGLPGDIDGDGLPELLAGAYEAGGGDGAVYLFLGDTLSGVSALDDADADYSWVGGTDDSVGSGSGLAGINDLGGDGRPELLVGAFKADVSGGVNAGALYLLRSDDRASWSSGGEIADDAALVLYGEAENDYCAISLGGGDLDADGEPDLALGCYSEDSGASNAGVEAIFLGASGLSGSVPYSDADALLTGDNSNDYLGWQGSQPAGDVNGDGYPDLYLGAYQMDGLDNNAGAALLVSGDDLADGTASDLAFVRLKGEVNGDRMGYAGASVSDVDGDGADDLFVAADKTDGGASDGGSLYFWYGGAGLSGELDITGADMTWHASSASESLGRFIASGDMDADGRGDLLVASPYADNSVNNAGSVYLLAGADHASWTGALSSDAQARVDGAGDTDLLGFGVALGDLNGDSYDDLVAGALYSDEGGSNAGTLYAFFGR